MRVTLNKILESKINRYALVLVFIPLCLVAVLAPYSLLVGWNMGTLLLFWFIIVPVLTIFLSSKLLRRYHRMSQALLAMISFYAFMVFMIYDHYQSDYFVLMIASLVFNSLVMLFVLFVDWYDMRKSAPEQDAVSGK